MTSESHEETTGENSGSESHSFDRRRFLKAGTGAAVAAIGLPTVSGVAAAHFHGSDKATLNIDIKPDSTENTINPKSEGVVPVAVLHTEEFDPTSQNVNYRFGAQDVVANGGGARPIHDGHATDVNGDGQCDLVLHFPVEDTGFDGDETVGHLHWEKGEKGAHHGLGGSDAITIVGSEKQSSHSSRKSSQSSQNVSQESSMTSSSSNC